MQRAPKIIDFLEVHFNVHCRCISQSPFGQLLLCTFNYYIMMCSGRMENIKLYIWPIFTCVNRTFDAGYPVHVSLLPLCFVRSRNSVYFLVRFPLSDERTWVARQENSIGADGESLLTTQPSHIWWDYKIYTRYLIYAFSAIQPSCFTFFKWPLSTLFNLPTSMLGLR